MPFDFPTAPTSGDIYSGYVWDGITWNLVGSATAIDIGTVKSGFQVADHAGWIKLDGRAITTLTASQQTNAIALGFATNLPNGQLCGLRQDSAAAPGVVGGSAKISVANLPAHNMTAASAGAHTHVTDTQGAHSEHVPFASVYGSETATTRSAFNSNAGTETMGAHTHTAQSAGAHTHTVALGGSGTDYYAKAMVVNFFVYLGT